VNKRRGKHCGVSMTTVKNMRISREKWRMPSAHPTEEDSKTKILAIFMYTWPKNQLLYVETNLPIMTDNKFTKNPNSLYL
jgi:hypothetical protein